MKQLMALIMCLSLVLAPVTPVSAKEESEGGGKGFYANQILAVGTACIGSSILMSCKLATVTPSMMIFFGGSLAYIASEFMGAKAQKAFLKSKKEEIEQLKATMQQGGDLQRGIIEAKLKEEEEKLGFVKKRKTWMLAITGIYTAASAMAAVEMACVSSGVLSVTCPQWVDAGCTPAGAASATLQAKAIAMAYNFGVNATSGGGKMSLYGGMLVALTTFVPSAAAMVMKTHSQPMARIATFGAAAVLSGVVVSGLASTAKELEGNISELKKLLADFESKTETRDGLQEDGSASDPNLLAEDKKYKLKELPKGQEVAQLCWSNTSGGLSYSEKSCSNPLKVPRAKMGDIKMNIPTLKSVGNTAGEFAQAVSGGDVASADVAAGSLASQAGRMTEVRDNLFKQINDELKSKGKKPIDFDGEINKRVTSMMGELNNTPAFSGGAPTMAGKASLDDSDSDMSGTANTSTGINKASSDEKIAVPSAGFEFNEGMTEAASDSSGAENYTTATLSEGLNDYELNESDISKKSEESIFKQVSNRYLLSYPKFFERKLLKEGPND